MCRHAQLTYEKVDFPEEGDRINQLKAYEDKPAEEHREYESKDLVVGDGAAEQAYRDECRAEE